MQRLFVLVRLAAVVAVAACANSTSAEPVPLNADASRKNGPAKDWWDGGKTVCPDGASLRGAPLPKGLRVWCATDAEIAHGRATSWYRSGAIESDGHYVDGARHGEWRDWDVAGSLHVSVWVHGKEAPHPSAAYAELRVTHAGTGLPASGLLVAIFGETEVPVEELSAVSSRDGVATFGPLEPGVYEVRIWHSSATAPVVVELKLSAGDSVVVPISVP